MNGMTSEELIANALATHQGALVCYAKSITGDTESARDAVQETFLKLSRQDVHTLSDRMAAWLFYVCRNCALDYRRKIIRMPAVSLDEWRGETDGQPDPSEIAVVKEESSKARRLVSLLPENQRELVELKFSACLSYKDMAEVTGLSVSNVGFQLHDAITKLRKMWSESPTPNIAKNYG
jgi:RNA polymerase sigma-70 factor (ECF subfamily)